MTFKLCHFLLKARWSSLNSLQLPVFLRSLFQASSSFFFCPALCVHRWRTSSLQWLRSRAPFQSNNKAVWTRRETKLNGFLKKSSLCLCLCTLTSLSKGDTVWADACRDAWLTREGEKQRQRLLYCKYVSVKYWCVLDDSLELTFSPFSCIKVFSCKLPSLFFSGH